MRAELRGAVPKLPFAFAGTLINRAWRNIRENHLWSFQLGEFAWITPPPLTTGTATFSTGFDTVTFDATAQAAITAWQAANPYALFTTQQFRGGNVAGLSGVYNIIAYDSGTGIATLDRIYADPGGTNAAYTVFQCYYVAPWTDFFALLSVRNMQMFLNLDIDHTRAWVDARDPQRSWYQFPTHVIPWGADQRGSQASQSGLTYPSSTLGQMLFELWGIPVTPFTYDVYAIRRGSDLVNATDTLPYNIGQDVVMELAKYYAYEWAEANMTMVPRAQGPDFRFLMGQAMSWYNKLLSQYKRDDKEALDNYLHAKEPDISSMAYGYYNTISGVSGPYTQYGISFVTMYLLASSSSMKLEWNPLGTASVVLLCVFAATLLAISGSLRREVEVIARKGMSIFAKFFSRILGRTSAASKNILAQRGDLQMPRVAAERVSAEMVESHIFRNRFSEKFIKESVAVRGDFPSFDFSEKYPTIGTVSTAGSRSCPIPASGLPVDVDLLDGPKNGFLSILHDGIVP